MRVVLVLVILVSLNIFGYETEMKFIRETFYQAVEDEKELKNLEKFLIMRYSEDQASYPPVILAYSGVVEALKAKHVFSPFSKFSHLIKALSILDEAVSRMPGDLEVRFLRFSVLDNMPSFLGYNKEKKEDQRVIIAELLRNDYSRVDKQTQRGLVEYLLDSNNISRDEKYLLNDLYISVYE
jgi:hypothetical protein